MLLPNPEFCLAALNIGLTEPEFRLQIAIFPTTDSLSTIRQQHRFYGQIPLFSPLLLHDLLLPYHWYEINLNPLIQCDRASLKHRPRYCLIIVKQTSQGIAQPVP
ncbi:MAG: hypothetical protein OXI24_17155 [Candidatus Poribacteria bacterium]|nr:hypothetical protein [Candidatus Poribacteria bacterium]MYC14104.1 hypothetical protein [Gemmatimonadota bacterium]